MKFKEGDEVRLTGPFTWQNDENSPEWDKRILAISPQRFGIIVSNPTDYKNTLRVNYGTEPGNKPLILYTDQHLLVHVGPTEDEVQEALSSIFKAAS